MSLLYHGYCLIITKPEIYINFRCTVTINVEFADTPVATSVLFPPLIRTYTLKLPEFILA